MSEIEQEHESPEPGPVSPEPDQPPRRKLKRTGVGGTYSHKTDCKCRPCKSRQRLKEAVAVAAGVGGSHMAPADTPIKPITTAQGVRRAPPRSLRERVAQYLHFRILYPDQTLGFLAEKMGTSRNTLHRIVKEGQESGILVFDDPLERIEYQLVPKIVENLNYFLDAKDKTVTIEAAKGTIFRQYQDSKGITDGGTTVLALKIEHADGQEVKVVTGRIVGKPKGLLGTPYDETQPLS